ncbi:MAG: hypothetical protein LUD02_01870 [Tannerellaceae bacterium]|nr:hypothetical protein [Tannerellaceae bacterium]
MKRSFISMLTVAALVCGMSSCNGAKKASDEEAKNEAAAVIAGNVSRGLLTEELRTETIQFLKDMPDSEIPYRIASGEVKLSVGNTGYMLPVTKAAELNTAAQKARACGMYFSDYNVLKAMNQPVKELESVLVKLTTDLDIAFVQNIMTETAPANASKEEYRAFLQQQEEKLIQALADNDKIELEVELLGGLAAENACIVAEPTLVIEGDATSAGLSENMEKRIELLGQITNDLSEYYPDLKDLGDKLAPLNEKLTTVQIARDNNAEILAIRNSLLQ